MAKEREVQECLVNIRVHKRPGIRAASLWLVLVLFGPSFAAFPPAPPEHTSTRADSITTSAPASAVPVTLQSGPLSPFVDSGISFIGIRRGDIAWGDYDNDGWLDLAICGFANVPGNRATRLYRNIGGTAFSEVSQALPDVRDCALAFGDYDNDGDLDLAHTGDGSSGLLADVYRNDDGSFVGVGAGILAVSLGDIAWADVNNDGRLDLAVTGSDAGQNGVTRVYLNTGAGSFADSGETFIGVKYSSLAFADYDLDGDLDVVVSGFVDTNVRNRLELYRNSCSGHFQAQTTISKHLAPISGGQTQWCDYDSDGSPDLIVTGFSNDEQRLTNVYHNNPQFQTFRTPRLDFANKLVGLSNAALAVADFDADGDPDLALLGDSGEERVTRIYGGDGAGNFVDTGAFLVGVDLPSVAWADFDNDRDLDLAFAGSSLTAGPITRLYRNDSASPNAAPLPPAGLSGIIAGASGDFRWFPGTDVETHSSGLSYNLRVGKSPGASDVFSGMADTVTGKRLLPATANTPGRSTWQLHELDPKRTYYWSVQSIDGSLEGSAWAAESILSPGTLPSRADDAIPLAIDQPISGATEPLDLKGVVRCGGGLSGNQGAWFSVKGNGKVLTATLSGQVPNDITMHVYCDGCMTQTCTGTYSDFDYASGLWAISWCSEPGRSYTLLVSSRHSAAFDLVIESGGLGCAARACDDATGHTCSLAREIADGQVSCVNVDQMDLEADAVVDSCSFCGYPNCRSEDVWWKYAPEHDGLATIDVRLTCGVGSVAAAPFSLFNGACIELIELGVCSPRSCIPDARGRQIRVTKGEDVLVRVNTSEVDDGFGVYSACLRVALDPFDSPTILRQPVSLVKCLGETARFTVRARGTAAMTYQWYKGGTSIDGEIGESIVVGKLQADDAGEYSCLVENVYGPTWSDPAVLAIDEECPGYPYVSCAHADLPCNPVDMVGLKETNEDTLVAVGCAHAPVVGVFEVSANGETTRTDVTSASWDDIRDIAKLGLNGALFTVAGSHGIGSIKRDESKANYVGVWDSVCWSVGMSAVGVSDVNNRGELDVVGVGGSQGYAVSCSGLGDGGGSGIDACGCEMVPSSGLSDSWESEGWFSLLGQYSAVSAGNIVRDVAPEEFGDFQVGGIARDQGDLVMLDTLANSVRVLANNGPSAYPIGWEYDWSGDAIDVRATADIVAEIPYEPVALVVADFDGDEWDDVAVANRLSGSVSVLMNVGEVGPGLGVANVVALAASRGGTDPEPVHMIAEDVDGDHDLDLIVVSVGLPLISILTNNGGGAFTLSNSIALPSDAVPVAIDAADFSRDGRPDLIIADGGAAPRLIFVVAVTPGDSSGDGLHSSDEATALASCLTGPKARAEPVGLDCQCAFLDMDQDGDVDLRDAQQSMSKLGTTVQ